MPQKMLVYIGTYTRTTSKGIYVYRFDPSSGALEYVSEAAGLSNPSFVALHPSGRYLYSVNELGQFEGKPSGGVSAFAIDPATGGLTLLNQQPSVGTGPCHISIESTGRYALVANYAGGSVTMLPIEADGKLGAPCDFVQHEGSSVNLSRQKAPHAHSINPDPTNRYAYVPDLGTDKIVIYQLDLANGKLAPNDPPFARVKAGSGPRHMDFHPNGKFAYVINEIGSTITVFDYDAATGALKEKQMISTLPEDFMGVSHTADIHVAASGKFLYGSNRGHDSIAIFAVDEATGKLSPIGYESTRGRFPRNFALDPTGNFLLAANQNTDNIFTYRIDQATGKLTWTGHETKVGMPVCLKFLVM